MALDPQVVGTRLAALNEYLAFLVQIAKLDPDNFLAEARNYGSAERFLQLAIEAVFDIGAHCIAALGLHRPERYADILPALADAGVIRRETADELTNLAGFRNVLVHDYIALDRGRVYAFLTTKLDGLRHFAADISTCLQEQHGGSPAR